MYADVFRGEDKQWYVNLVGDNGEVMTTSEGYSRKWSAKRAARNFTRDVRIVQ